MVQLVVNGIGSYRLSYCGWWRVMGVFNFSEPD